MCSSHDARVLRTLPVLETEDGIDAKGSSESESVTISSADVLATTGHLSMESLLNFWTFWFCLLTQIITTHSAHTSN